MSDDITLDFKADLEYDNDDEQFRDKSRVDYIRDPSLFDSRSHFMRTSIVSMIRSKNNPERLSASEETKE